MKYDELHEASAIFLVNEDKKLKNKLLITIIKSSDKGKEKEKEKEKKNDKKGEEEEEEVEESLIFTIDLLDLVDV